LAKPKPLQAAGHLPVRTLWTDYPRNLPLSQNRVSSQKILNINPATI